jgi:hypothetical protein
MVVALTIPERYGGGGVAWGDYAEGTSGSASDDENAVVRLLASRGRDGHNAFLIIMTAPLLPSFQHLPHEYT